jgi:K+-transporting ATPase A subunit
MELVLNLAWLALCLGLLVFFGPSLKKPAAGRTRGVALVAMLCILFLLFQVISISDDLSANPALFEATKFKNFSVMIQALAALLAWVIVLAPQSTRLMWARRTEKSVFPLPGIFAPDLFRRPPPSFCLA